MGRPETSRPVAKFSTTGPFVVQCATRCGERRYLRSAAPALGGTSIVNWLSPRGFGHHSGMLFSVTSRCANHASVVRNAPLGTRLASALNSSGSDRLNSLSWLTTRPRETRTLFVRMRVMRFAMRRPPLPDKSEGTTSITRSPSDPDKNSGPVEDPDRQARAKNCHQDSHDQGNERPHQHLAQARVRWWHREVAKLRPSKRHQLSPEALTKRPIRPQPPKVSVRRIARSLSPAASGRYKRA